MFSLMISVAGGAIFVGLVVGGIGLLLVHSADLLSAGASPAEGNASAPTPIVLVDDRALKDRSRAA